MFKYKKFFTIFFMLTILLLIKSNSLYAFNESHLKRLTSQNECKFCDLSGADLRGVNLTRADLRGANLTGADLVKANLKDANLKEANLERANLLLANLTGTNLMLANLKGARNLEKAIGNPSQNKAIEMLYKMELMFADLYDDFAYKFPEHKIFWQGLAQDERKHAKWVKELYQYERKYLVTFSEGEVSTSGLIAAFKHIEKTIQLSRNDEIDFKSAVFLTLDIERTLIDHEVFTFFEIPSEFFSNYMTWLEQETKAHAKKAEDMIKKLYG